MRTTIVSITSVIVSIALAPAGPQRAVARATPQAEAAAAGLPGECGVGPGELPALDCSQEPLLRSLNGDTPTSVEFVNATDGPVNVYWIDYEGSRVLYHELLPAGQSVQQPTYVTHPWVVTDEADGCLAIFQPVSQPARATICPAEPAATAQLTWSAPAGGPLDPPQNLTARIVGVGPGSGPPALARGGPEVCGYNVYRFDEPGGQPSPGNLIANVSKENTQVVVPLALRGNYFVVTACYPEGESGPSNEAGAGTPGATIERVVVRAKKLVTFGSGFTDTVRIFLDGVEFASEAAVKKNNTKAVQKGALATGLTIREYMTPGRMVEIAYVNGDQGLTRLTIEVPSAREGLE
jgi:hypothetical protein